MKFVDDARKWHKFASVRLAAVMGAVLAYLVADPMALQSLVALIPDGPWRTVIGAVAGFIVFSAPTILRVLKFKGEPE